MQSLLSLSFQIYFYRVLVEFFRLCFSSNSSYIEYITWTIFILKILCRIKIIEMGRRFIISEEKLNKVFVFSPAFAPKKLDFEGAMEKMSKVGCTFFSNSKCKTPIRGCVLTMTESWKLDEGVIIVQTKCSLLWFLLTAKVKAIQQKLE